MKVMRVLALGLILALGGCAAGWRPDAFSHYSCVNTDVRFAVTYSWNPPAARLMFDERDPIDLQLASDIPRRRNGAYTFAAEQHGVRLTLIPRYAYLSRPDLRELRCEEEFIVVT